MSLSETLSTDLDDANRPGLDEVFERDSPAPHRFIRNINTTLSEQIFNISVAEGKPLIPPDSMLNDHGWKAVSGIRDVLHPAALLRHQQVVTLLGWQHRIKEPLFPGLRALWTHADEAVIQGVIDLAQAVWIIHAVEGEGSQIRPGNAAKGIHILA